MFPNDLDGAKVLEYTSKGHYGFFADYDENNTPVNREICYLAICRYEVSEYYLFCCDEQYDVMTDSCFDTIIQCKTYCNLPKDTVWHQKEL